MKMGRNEIQKRNLCLAKVSHPPVCYTLLCLWRITPISWCIGQERDGTAPCQIILCARLYRFLPSRRWVLYKRSGQIHGRWVHFKGAYLWGPDATGCRWEAMGWPYMQHPRDFGSGTVSDAVLTFSYSFPHSLFQ